MNHKHNSWTHSLFVGGALLIIWVMTAWAIFTPTQTAYACASYPANPAYAYSLNNSPNVNSGAQAGAGNFTYAGNAAVAPALTVGGDNAVTLDGTGDRMNMNSHAGGTNLNQGQTTQLRTYMVWFNATTTTGNRQIWEHGGQTNGAGMYIQGGTLYGGVWKNDTTLAFLSMPITAGDTYFAVLQYDPAATGVLTLYVNSTVTSTTGIGATNNGTNANAIGGVNGNTRRHDASTGTADFQGVIDDFRVYYSMVPISTLNTIFVPGGGSGCHPTAVSLSGWSTAVGSTAWFLLIPATLLMLGTITAWRRRSTA